MRAVFCYQVSREANWGVDGDGNPCGIYVKFGLNNDDGYIDIPEDTYEEIHNKNGIKVIAEQLKTKEEYVTPCTLEKYILETDEDEETEVLKRILEEQH